MNSGVYIPVWKRPPNKFLRYELKDFDGGKVRIAIYTDKHGNQKSETAQVLWSKKP